MSLLRAAGLAIRGRLSPTSLELQAGTLTCLIGPNGSGKTSLLHALARIGRSEGEVRIDGKDPAELPPNRRARLLGYLPATRDLAWPLRAGDLVRLSGASEDEVGTAMERLELTHMVDRRTDFLSTGERSRVLIARAMATEPRLLLLDEPTANLDPLWQIRLMEMLRSDVRATGRAALVAMHDLDAAARYADRIVVMAGGQVAADGEPGAVLASPDIARVFGIERSSEGWRPALSPAADQRSSQ